MNTTPTTNGFVRAGGVEILTRPARGREVADLIPGSEIRLQHGEAHQPFQERPDEWNATVHEFWSHVGASVLTS